MNAKHDSVAVAPFFFFATEGFDYELIDLDMSLNFKSTDFDYKEYFESYQKNALNAKSVFIRKTSLTDLFRDKSETTSVTQARHPNITCFVGGPGMGKTALAQIYLQRYIEDKPFVFFLQCNQIDFDATTNLLQLLATSLPYQWIYDKSACENVLNKLSQSDRVVIFVDDLHFALKHFPSFRSEISLDDERKPGHFIKNLMSHDSVLPKAQIFANISSQSLNYTELKSFGCRFVSILGFSNDKLKNLCNRVFYKNFTSILDLVFAYPSLSSYCYIPQNCGFVMFAANACLSQDTLSVNPPLTQVVVLAYSLLMQSKNLQLQEIVIKELAQCAWKQIINKKFAAIDEIDSLRNCNREIVSTITFDATTNTNNTLKNSQWFHFVWLELLAAFHCIINMELDDLVTFLFPEEKYPDYQVWSIAMHVAGLCGKNTLMYLEEFLTSRLFDEKIGAVFEKIQTIIVTSINVIQSFSLDSLRLFIYASCLSHSLQNKDLAVKCVSQLNNYLKISGDLHPNDIAGLHFVIQKKIDFLLLDVATNTKFFGNGFKLFLKFVWMCSNVQVT